MDQDIQGDAAHAGPLAEYTALRAESLQCSQYMSVLFSLLIASTGVVLGVALRPQGGGASLRDSHGAPLTVLLVLPVVSYLISVRYTYLHLGTLRIGRYIDEKLAGKIPGGIGWETWLQEMRVRGPSISQRNSDQVAFIGTSLLGLAGPVYPLVSGGASNWFWVLWAVDALLTVMTFWVVASRNRNRNILRMTRGSAASAGPTTVERKPQG